MEKYRAVVYGNLHDTNTTTYSEPLDSPQAAGDFIDRLTRDTGFTGGHIEQLIQLSGKSPEWYMYC